MNNFFKRYRYLLIFCSLLTVLIVFGYNLFIGRLIVHFYEQHAAAIFKKSLGIDLKISQIQVHELTFGVSLMGVRGEVPQKFKFHAQTIRANLDFWSLLTRKVRMSEVIIEQATFEKLTTSDQRPWNLNQIDQGVREAEKWAKQISLLNIAFVDSGTKLLRIQLANARIEKGQVELQGELNFFSDLWARAGFPASASILTGAKGSVLYKDQTLFMNPLRVRSQSGSWLAGTGKLSFDQQDLKRFRYQAQLTATIGWAEFFQQLLPQMKLEAIKGQMNLRATVSGTSRHLQISANVCTENAKLPFAPEMKKICLQAEHSRKGTKILDLKGTLVRGGSIQATGALEANTLVVNSTLQEVPLPEILSFIPQVAARTTGVVSGDLQWRIDRQKIVLSGRSALTARQVSIFTDARKLVLALGVVRINDFDAKLLLNPMRFEFVGQAQIQKSPLMARGYFSPQGMKISLSSSDVDLNSLGPVMGLKLHGRGGLDLFFTGPYQQLILDIAGNLKFAQFLGFQLGSVVTKMNYQFSTTQLNLEYLVGKYGHTDYSLFDGLVAFRQQRLKIPYTLTTGEYQDALAMFDRIFHNIAILPRSQINGRYASFGVIGGRPTAEGVEVQGIVLVENLVRSGSDLFGAFFQLHTQGKNFAIENLLVMKEQTELSGSFRSWRGVREGMIAFRGIAFESVTPILAMRGNYSGEVSGVFHAQNGIETSTLFVQEYTGSDLKWGHSFIQTHQQGDRLKVHGDLFGSEVLFDLIYRRQGAMWQRDQMNLTFQIKEMRKYVSLLSRKNVMDEGFRGALMAQLDFQFCSGHALCNLDLNIDDFYFIKNDMSLSVVKKNAQLKIRNGQIEKGLIELFGDGGRLTLSGKNSAMGLGRAQIWKLQSNFDLKFLEFISPYAYELNGNLESGFHFKVSEEGIQPEADIVVRNGSFRIEKMPSLFDHVEVHTTYRDGRLIFEKAHGFYGGGEFTVKGDIDFVKVPDVNLQIGLRESKIDLLKNSTASFSGAAFLTGRQRPYTLSGNMVVSRLLFGEAFGKDKKGIKQSDHEKYLRRSGNQLIALDLDVDLQSVQVKNKLVDMQLSGAVKVTESLFNPMIRGQIHQGENGKIFFRSNEFSMSEAIIGLDDYLFSMDPRLDIKAESDVLDYKVKLTVSGKSSRPDLLIESSPMLPREEVLSLLMFGYTKESSTIMTAQEREVMATAGIGGYIFEQSNINDDLRDKLGVKLSLAPEYLQNESSLLESDTATSRSATKIKISKKINKKTDVAVSSILGASDEQKQEMNLNYRVNDLLYFQGVYEMRNETETSSSAAGADIKLRWTFE